MIVPTKVVSLFAGVGGFDLGFERSGFNIVAHVEKDANCRKLLRSKWPDAVCLDDVCTAGAHNLPECDVITFGFPCQDLSLAGKRAGLSGERSGLFYEATRIIRELQPTWALFENVPGLLSSKGCRDFALVLHEMGECGYHGAWRVLDAQWFGVAQRRRRVFGLFTRLDSGAERCAEILSIEESLRGHPAPSRESWQGVAGGFETGPNGGRFTSVAPTMDCLAKDGPIRNQLGVGDIVPATCCTIDTFSGRDRKIGNQQSNSGHIIPDVAGCLHETEFKGSFWDGGQVCQTLDAVLAKGQTMPEKNRFPAVLVPSGRGSCTQATARSAKVAENHSVSNTACTTPTAHASGQPKTSPKLSTRSAETPCGREGVEQISDTKPATRIAVNSGKGYWRESDHAGTLGTEARAVHENNLVPVAFGGDVARTLNARHDSSPCADRGMDVVAVPVAFQQNTRDEVRMMNGDGQIAGALSASAGMKQQNYIATPWDGQRARIHDARGVAPTLQSQGDESGNQIPAVAVDVAQVQWASGGGQTENTTAQALRSNAEHNYQFARVGMEVRRLTPREAERLQGFQWLCAPSDPGAWQDELGRWWSPDWTAGFSDSTRYKMMGNAVCVNVSEWIARRLMKYGINKKGE